MTSKTTPMLAPQRLYVFAPTPDGPQLAGRFEWHNGVGVFEYAPSWLENTTHRYALDPLNLPLTAGPKATRVNNGVHGVLADAGPDSWGRHLMEMAGRSAHNPIEMLRLSNGSGTGGLMFSQARSQPNPVRSVLPYTQLERLEHTMEELDLGHQVTNEELKQLFEAGSYSLGGARPKALVAHQDHTWIAKFERNQDHLSMPQVEYACLQLAQACGLPVPEHQLLKVGRRSVLLVKRFDRANGERLHYLSLHALLSLEKMAATDVVAPTGRVTYGNCAALTRKIGVENTGPAFFDRMVFNVLIGNTDDHLRNQGLLFNHHTRQWDLAPCFDLTAVGGTLHAIGLGVSGRERSWENALSDAPRFNLKEGAARERMENMSSLAQQHVESCLQHIENPLHRHTVMNRLMFPQRLQSKLKM